MTQERYKEIYDEANRRLMLWLNNSSFDAMTIGGSYLRFNMALGLLGYPFELESWMNEFDFEKFITQEEYESEFYDIIMDQLFDKAQFIHIN